MVDITSSLSYEDLNGRLWDGICPEFFLTNINHWIKDCIPSKIFDINFVAPGNLNIFVKDDFDECYKNSYIKIDEIKFNLDDLDDRIGIKNIQRIVFRFSEKKRKLFGISFWSYEKYDSDFLMDFVSNRVYFDRGVLPWMFDIMDKNYRNTHKYKRCILYGLPVNKDSVSINVLNGK